MSKILLKEIYPSVDKNLSKPENRKLISNHLTNYLNRNSEILTMQGPVYRTTFSDKDRQVLYDATGTNPQDTLKVIKTIPNVKSNKNILKEPYMTLNGVCMRWAVLFKNEEFITQLQMGLLLSFYPSLHAKYFRFIPNKDIMDYTVNNLSNKYTIKRETTIFHAMLATVKGALPLHQKRLIDGNDKYVIGYVLDVKTRLSSLMKKIANEFYDNHKKGLYLSKGEDLFDEENNLEYDSNTYAVSRLTDKVVIMLLTNGPNKKLVDASANMNSVSKNELRNYTNQLIVSDNRPDIREIVENILTYYLIQESHKESDIKSKDFLIDCMILYRASNVKDTHILKIKEILNKWMQNVGAYEKTNNKTTLNNFRRALYTFFVLSIQSGV